MREPHPLRRRILPYGHGLDALWRELRARRGSATLDVNLKSAMSETLTQGATCRKAATPRLVSLLPGSLIPEATIRRRLSE